MKPRTVAIIGSGLSGLAAACTLAGRGYSVTVYAVQDQIDRESHWQFFTFPRVLDRIFRECNRKVADYVTLMPIDPQVRCFVSDRRIVDIRRDIDATCVELDKFSKGASNDYRKLLLMSQRMRTSAEQHLYWRNIGGWKNLVRLNALADLWSLKLNLSASSLIRRIIRNGELAMLMMAMIRLQSPATELPGFACSLLDVQTTDGVWRLKSGTQPLNEQLLRLAGEMGVTFCNESVVPQVSIDGHNRVVSVTTRPDVTTSISAAISTLGAEQTSNLFGAKTTFESPVGTCDSVYLKLTLDRAYGHLLPHNLIDANEWPDRSRQIVYVAVDSIATNLAIQMPVPETERQHWHDRWPEYRRIMFQALATNGGMIDLEQRIQQENVECVRMNSPNGVCWPANRSREVRGLYFAGGGAHPGPGIAMSLMSGWIAADAMDEDNYLADIKRKLGK